MAKRRGRGVAACWYGIARTATVDRAGAWAELDDGGTAKIVTGVHEIGEGILTVLAQIAAQEMGVRPRSITIGIQDTARSPEAAHAGATRQTYMIGNAVALASRQARAMLGRCAGQTLGRRSPQHRRLPARPGPKAPTTRCRWPKRCIAEPRRRSRRLGFLRHRHHRARPVETRARAVPGRPTCSAAGGRGGGRHRDRGGGCLQAHLGSARCGPCGKSASWRARSRRHSCRRWARA